jgi:hypothetical protein
MSIVDIIISRKFPNLSSKINKIKDTCTKFLTRKDDVINRMNNEQNDEASYAIICHKGTYAVITIEDLIKWLGVDPNIIDHNERNYS